MLPIIDPKQLAGEAIAGRLTADGRVIPTGWSGTTEPNTVARPPHRPRVYIAGPISKGDLAHNVNQATEAFVRLAKAGLAPFCPHWSVYSKPAFRYDRGGGEVVCVATTDGNPDMTHADWLGIDLTWVEAADYLVRLPGESVGADLEVAHAKARGIPVFQSVAALVAHYDRGLEASYP